MTKLLIIGDGIIDRYIWGLIRRQSPEDSNAPVVDFIDEEYKLGGAYNVACNLKSLSKKNTEIYISSIISDYTANLLKEKKISYDEIVLKTKDEKNPHLRELIKTRIINSSTAKQIVRLDNREKFAESDLQRYKNKCYYSNFIDFDAIIVSDYDKGIIDNFIIEKLSKVNCPVFVDTKKKDLSLWKDIGKCFVKINSKEFSNSVNSEKIENLIVTEGNKGSSYYKKGLLDSFHRTNHIEDADVVGAGDVYLAGFALKYMETKDIIESMKFANKVAGISVTKFGTAIVEKGDLE